MSPPLTVGKPTILLVMHHQLESVLKDQTQVTSPKVCLTLDLLHYQGKLNKCWFNTVAGKAVTVLIRASYKEKNRKVSGLLAHLYTSSKALIETF